MTVATEMATACIIWPRRTARRLARHYGEAMRGPTEKVIVAPAAEVHMGA
jgi:hypothetical protein